MSKLVKLEARITALQNELKEEKQIEKSLSKYQKIASNLIASNPRIALIDLETFKEGLTKAIKEIEGNK